MTRTRLWCRIFVALLFLGGSFGTAVSADVERLDRMARHELEARTASSIYNLLPSDLDYFSLSRILQIRKPPNEQDPVPIRLYGDRVQEYDKISCEKDIRFTVSSYANRVGEITIGVCPGLASSLESLIQKTTGRLRDLVSLLQNPVGARPNEDALRRTLRYEKTLTTEGIEVHYFPLVTVGHGIEIEHTVLVVKGGNIVAVQGSFDYLCNSKSRPSKRYDRMCADTKAGFREMALLIYKDLFTR